MEQKKHYFVFVVQAGFVCGTAEIGGEEQMKPY